MSDSTLYDDDILLWSEQQAEVIRRLGRTRRDLPNDFDVENVAEEIESVGRSELASVESYIRLVLVHLIKLAAEPEAGAVRHWRGEVSGFASDLRRRYAPSMGRRIELDELWREAREQAALAADEAAAPVAAALPADSPVALDDLLANPIDITRLTERIRASCVAAGG